MKVAQFIHLLFSSKLSLNANNIAIKFSAMSDFSRGLNFFQGINLAKELLGHKDAHI